MSTRVVFANYIPEVGFLLLMRSHALQEWLWCETWCGNATKKYAKTIDLCNNPLTKEPKLEGARRIVKEWPGLDEEVASFTAQVIHSHQHPD